MCGWRLSYKINIKDIKPKEYIGQFIETRDSRFFDKEAEIVSAFISIEGDFCVRAYPDGLIMEWWYTPDAEGNIQIGRIHEKKQYV